MWIKVCGLTSEDAVAAALQARVDAVGFVLASSVRQLRADQAAHLAAMARGRAMLVAVTLHPTQALVDEIVSVLKPDALQADLADFARLQLPQTLTRLPVMRAGVISGIAVPERMLFEGARSGVGEITDWQVAAELALSSELILAGGLHAGNVAAAIGAVRPFGVDVSSGVEHSPGQKSPEKIAQFVAAARAAFQEAAHHGNRHSG
jgi:phosphoribosylanthranilate isomerase